MSLARFFSKPRWQSKDDAVRRSAVAADDHAELRAALPRLAREDTDAGVRLTALKRLADPGLAQALAQDDRDEGVRKAAQALWVDLLTGTHAAAPTLTERVRLLRAQDDPRLIEHMATRAPEAELRLAALQRVTRPALLVERATGDADSTVRLAALERIDDEAQLARIAERARKTDKKISRHASERLDALRLARGDSVAIGERARTLCERLERVLREGEDNDSASVIATAWAAIADKVTPELATRHAKARELFDLSRDPQRVAELRQRAVDREQIGNELEAIERELSAADAASKREQLTQRFDAVAERYAAIANDTAESRAIDPQRVRAIAARLAALEVYEAPVSVEAVVTMPEIEAEQTAAKVAREASAAEKQREREQQQTWIAELEQAVATTEQAIEAGNTASAHASWARVPDLRKRLAAAIPAALRRRLTDVENHYGDIAQWQRWSDNHRRKQLCDEIEALPASGPHPDALATRVREAQQEWAQLDRIEGRPSSATDGLAKRFRALCRQAIEPAKPYFEKRDELRKQHSQETVELIERVVAANGNEPDWRAIATLRKEATEALRGLDRVDPRERKALAQKLKDTLTDIDRRIDARNAEVEAAKAALIAQAEALSEPGDARSAISSARDLQKKWQACGNGRRGRDEAQWRAFRKAIDAVFARADNERAERSARDQQALQDAANLCAELEALASADNAAERGAITRIDSAWNALGVGDAALRQRYQSAQAAVRDAQARRERRKRRERFDIWLSHYELCRKLERGEIDVETAESEHASLTPLEIAAQEIQLRLQPLLSKETIRFGDSDALRDCVLELEQMTGIESPAEERQRRLDLQVEKLSARMRGTQAASPALALQNALSEWTRLGALPDADNALETRFKNALETALDTLA
jgi:hypothetical protein